MSRLFIILSLLILTSCSESLDIPLEPEVSVYLSNDREKTISLTHKDKEYAVLKEWLLKNNSGWHATSGEYPGGVYIKSGNHGIQVTEHFVIIYSTSHPEPRAVYIQKIGRDSLSEIRNIAR